MTHPFAGLVSGVQLGRHGIAHVGVWVADDVYEPTTITSVMPTDVQIVEVDATGLYCALIKRANYMGHNFGVFDPDAFGPDIALGLSLRASGFKTTSTSASPLSIGSRMGGY
jgi:hypothetical protein